MTYFEQVIYYCTGIHHALLLEFVGTGEIKSVLPVVKPSPDLFYTWHLDYLNESSKDTSKGL